MRGRGPQLSAEGEQEMWGRGCLGKRPFQAGGPSAPGLVTRGQPTHRGEAARAGQGGPPRSPTSRDSSRV